MVGGTEVLVEVGSVADVLGVVGVVVLAALTDPGAGSPPPPEHEAAASARAAPTRSRRWRWGAISARLRCHGGPTVSPRRLCGRAQVEGVTTRSATARARRPSSTSSAPAKMARPIISSESDNAVVNKNRSVDVVVEERWRAPKAFRTDVRHVNGSEVSSRSVVGFVATAEPGPEALEGG